MTKAREARKPHRTVRRDVLDFLRDATGAVSRAEIESAFPHLTPLAVDNALRGLSRSGRVRFAGEHGKSLWRATTDDDCGQVDLRAYHIDPRAEVRFAKLIGEQRYESIEHKPQGRLTASRQETFSAVGCAAAMCLG